MLAALSDFIDRDKGFSLVATAATAEGFLAAVTRVPVMVGIIDWTLPVMGGESLLDTLRLRPAPPRMIVYGAPRRARDPAPRHGGGRGRFLAPPPARPSSFWSWRAPWREGR